MDNNVVSLEAMRVRRAQQDGSKQAPKFAGRELRPLVATADRNPAALFASVHLTETNCGWCRAPVSMVNGTYACDACGKTKFVAFETIDTR
jgi:hypothetical protein